VGEPLKRSVGLLSAEVSINQPMIRLIILISLILLPICRGVGCSRIYPYNLSELFRADQIVRATAVKYIIPPDPNTWTTGVPPSTIEFKIEEKIWGVDVPNIIVLNGYLTNRDDFNEVPLPYRFVRPGGRAGSCFANSYKEGAQFLLFVKRSGSGYTTDFSALGPTNEQLHSPEDPWVKWVKSYLNPCAQSDTKAADYAASSKSELEDLIAKQQEDLEKYRIAKCYLVKYGGGSPEAAPYFKVVYFYESTAVRK